MRSRNLGKSRRKYSEKTLNNGTPTIVVFNKTDLCKPTKEHVQALRSRGYKVIETSAANREGISDLRDAIIQTVLEKQNQIAP